MNKFIEFADQALYRAKERREKKFGDDYKSITLQE